ncbi:ATP-binding protein [uncultured Streptomyces sp.]|uniref:ATP-binding response regulator n=1 Tax=uncultured Streptomyces sp. TaxID=174707 RepID=UPI00260519E7|nr:ATP-binding protein [uncultured Streptomyces sp.]
MTAPAADGTAPLATVALATEHDVFVLRRSGKAAAEALGVERQDQIRLATALSELGRDTLGSPGLCVEFGVVAGVVPVLRVDLLWRTGPGPGPEAVKAAARLVPVRHEAAERRVTIEQQLSVDATDPETLRRAREALRAHRGSSVLEDARAQTSDLIAALEESRAQREELHRLNEELEETNRGVVALYSELSAELEETNRGVVALYAELEEKSSQLREASEAKTRFWANVSHELRTPVNSVVGLARLLLETEGERLDEEQRRQIALISASGATLLALVDELLDVAKAESGRLEPHWEPVDLRATLGQLRGTLRGYETRGDVTLAVAEPDPALTLVSDEVMVTRILRNLLSNSLKFTEEGTVRLDVAAEPGPAGGEVVFTVSDTGVGIPPEEQHQIFEEFYQVRGSHQRGRSGTGLGLPYARRLAELLGGSLVLTSSPGRGTVVTVRLPAARPGADGPDDAAVTRRAVLVTVDDDEVFRGAIRPVLGQLADRVVEVGEGGRAGDTIRRERPDAVLLDLHMPDLDGYDVLADLAADPGTAGIPVIVITSAADGTLDHARLRHARAVLDKASLTLGRLARAFDGAPEPPPLPPHPPRPDHPPRPEHPPRPGHPPLQEESPEDGTR